MKLKFIIKQEQINPYLIDFSGVKTTPVSKTR